MNRATVQSRPYARRLVLYASKRDKADPPVRAGIIPVCETLRPQLVLLMGRAGFHALLSRAIALARLESPWLRGVEVKPDGSIDGLEALQSQLSSQEFLECQIAIAAQLLGLLVTFIGETLTMQITREAWPRLPGHLTDLSNEGTK